MFRLSDGLLASKLGLEFQVEPNDLSITSSKRITNHFSSSSKTSNTNTIVRQYRVKCTASMEKTIHSSVNEVHLGASKQSSGLHLAGNPASTSNINGNQPFTANTAVAFSDIHIIHTHSPDMQLSIEAKFDILMAAIVTFDPLWHYSSTE